MPWVKGQSGNPKGRAKEPVMMAFKAAKHGREAVVELIELMRSSPNDKVRLKAACAILDLGYGKPQQYVEPLEREPRRTITPATLEEWASILRQAGLLLPST